MAMPFSKLKLVLANKKLLGPGRGFLRDELTRREINADADSD
jgi:hypothetical protein